MSDVPPHYASYTHKHPNILIRYPHQKRNQLVAEKIAGMHARSWFDYGAGDGALLNELVCREALPNECVLYEPDAFMRTQLVSNIAGFGLEGRVECVAELDDSGARYDLITALEVLEHLPLPERLKFYGFLTNRLAEGGKVLIELPIEYGPMLLFKEWGRKFLENRVSEYSARELLDAALFAKIHDAHLRYMTNDERTFISLHRGFDLAKLIVELSSFGTIKEIVRSPFQFLPRMFNQVVLFSYEIHERDISRIEEAVIRVSMSNR